MEPTPGKSNPKYLRFSAQSEPSQAAKVHGGLRPQLRGVPQALWSKAAKLPPSCLCKELGGTGRQPKTGIGDVRASPRKRRNRSVESNGLTRRRPLKRFPHDCNMARRSGDMSLQDNCPIHGRLPTLPVMICLYQMSSQPRASRSNRPPPCCFDGSRRTDRYSRNWFRWFPH